VIIRKYTPRVRSATRPIRPDTAVPASAATSQISQALAKPPSTMATTA